VEQRVSINDESRFGGIGDSTWFYVLWCGVRKSVHSVAGSGKLWKGGGGV